MYISIDTETLGLNHRNCDIIEFGAVIDDLKSPIDSLPRFHCYLVKENKPNNEVYYGEAYAMSMHSKILKRIATRESGFNYFTPETFYDQFQKFLIDNKVNEDKHVFDEQGKTCIKDVLVAGKNFAGFDLKFLEMLPNFGRAFKFFHRFIDPMMLYFDPLTMKTPPSLDVCLKLAGIEKEVQHTAVEDAIDVIKCLRFKWNIK